MQTFYQFISKPGIKNLPENEQRRLYYVYRNNYIYESAVLNSQKSTAVSSGGSLKKQIEIIVENSLVRDATVVIGWINGIQWENEDGSIGLISRNDAFLATTTTNEFGTAIVDFNPQWIVTDFSTGDPVQLHAPIISYNGTTLEGNDSITLTSNVATPVLNPVTTAISEVEPYRSLQQIPAIEREEIFDYLEEWTESTITPADRELITNGQRIRGDIYEVLTRPTINSRALFEALELDEREINIQPSPEVSVVISSRVLQTPIISGLDKFGNYVGDRRRSAVSATSVKEFAPVAASQREIERILGVTISDSEVKANLLKKLYQAGLTAQEVLDFLDENSADIDFGNDQCCPTATVNITLIETDGVFTILSEKRLATGATAGSILGTEDTGRGATIITNKEIPIENEEEVKGKWQYTSPVGESLNGNSDLSGFIVNSETTGKETRKLRNVLYTINVVDIEGDQQQTSSIEYIIVDDEPKFRTVATGTIISPVKVIGDDGSDTPETIEFVPGSINRDQFVPSGDPVTLELTNREIGGRPSWSGTGESLLFWSGTNWIYSESGDPRDELTGGDGDLPFGQYSDRFRVVKGLVQEPGAKPPGSGGGFILRPPTITVNN